MDTFKIEHLSPEWAVFIRCPYCPARTFACCAECAEDAMQEHLESGHTAR